MSKFRITLLLFVLLASILLVGCNEMIPPDLVIQDWDLKQDYWWYVEGTAKNKGGHADYCEISVKFYDDEDSLIDNSPAVITDLGADETWSFKTSLIDTRTPDHAEVKVEECNQY